jgi:hypothetical protein
VNCSTDSQSDEERRSDEAADHRIADPEKTTYKVTAILLAYRKEKDGDFHLALQDPNSKATIIGGDQRKKMRRSPPTAVSLSSDEKYPTITFAGMIHSSHSGFQ